MKSFRFAKYIPQLIKESNNYALIITLQLIAGISSFIGLPMLMPIMSYMSGSELAEKDQSLLYVPRLLLGLFGVSVGFKSLLICTAILVILAQTLQIVASFVANSAQISLAEKFRANLIKGYEMASWDWLVNSKSGDINFAIIKEAETASLASLYSIRLILNIIQLGFMFLVALKISWVTTVLALAFFSVLSALSNLRTKLNYPLVQDYQLKFSSLSQTLHGIQTNKKFLKTSDFSLRVHENIRKTLAEITKNFNLQNLNFYGQYFISTNGAFLFLVGIMYFHQSLELSYSGLMLILLVFFKTSPQFITLTESWATYVANLPIYEKYRRRIDDFESNKEANGEIKVNNVQRIGIKNLSFEHHKDVRVLNNVNISIESHKITAIAGLSGAGKTTLLDILLGLWVPTEGQVFLDLVDLSTVNKESWRQKIAYVDQQTTFVDGTFLENLLPSNNVEDSFLAEILIKTGLDKVIESFPMKLEANIGENGSKLSGGQKQRLAIARALLTRPQFLILDEASSALDTESEAMINQTIQSIKEFVTIILVTHRITSLKNVDTIYFLDNGEVVQVGDFEKLSSETGLFKKLLQY